ncbi:uncharacterized protein EAE97_000391 [Botrytis byssoidea]|uniref:NB-ARC domain-containing protein n=1 Tax=Botrytis byssoidea TaxID=139641 RepID=A0A9P5IXN8_9HELO|nr:uncharacterized protein EAE97_000391 [Botrytis byssoidea]KAF7955132.1 hypothetical protein EAE97_000391 [Botrytis byssoidea]
MDSKRVFFRGLRSKPKEGQANDSIGNGEPAPKVETPKGAVADLISATSGSTMQHLYHLDPQKINPKSGKTFWGRATNGGHGSKQSGHNGIKAMDHRVLRKSLKVKDQVKGIMEAFQKVKELGTALASIDPIIFGSPWTGVSLLLTLVLSDFKQNETLLDGLETIADIRARYAVIESNYLKTAVTGDLGIQLESRVVKIYACILKYQAKAAYHLSKSTPIRFMRNLPKLDACRREILKRIEDAHLRNSSSEANMVVLRGIGGQGKTQIALKYCHIWRSKFEAVLWVDASSENSVIRSFETIYAKIKGPGNDCGSGDTKLDFVKDTIRTWNFRWLITFDNYVTPETFSLEKYIPHSIQGSVLVTTRHKDIDALVENTAAAIELFGLPDKEALQLLYQQSGTEEN